MVAEAYTFRPMGTPDLVGLLRWFADLHMVRQLAFFPVFIQFMSFGWQVRFAGN